MAKKWIKTQFPGVRYREHKTRKQSNGKPDRYFTIYYKLKGTLYEEALGWATDGWNASKASMERGKLKLAHSTGEGPQTMAEKKEKLVEEHAIEKEKKKQKMQDALTVGQFFKETYFPQAQVNKSKKSFDREEQLFRRWISPVIGELALKDVSPLHLEKIKKIMSEGKNSKRPASARSIRYALAVVRQIFNMARYLNLFDGQSPTRHVKLPQEDNRRLRFLTVEEADKLLAVLKIKSQQLYEISLLSLRTGARADEIFKLTWGDIDYKQGTLTLWDTKNTKTRMAFMTQDIIDMLSKKTQGKKNELVFPGRGGVQSKQVSSTFNRTIDELGLNDDIDDRRMKVVFHTLRHTYASWLVENGESLYTVKELMGHSTLAMTERYAHLGNGVLQKAVKRLENIDKG